MAFPVNVKPCFSPNWLLGPGLHGPYQGLIWDRVEKCQMQGHIRYIESNPKHTQAGGGLHFSGAESMSYNQIEPGDAQDHTHRADIGCLGVGID